VVWSVVSVLPLLRFVRGVRIQEIYDRSI
jgi:hypothetical protein